MSTLKKRAVVGRLPPQNSSESSESALSLIISAEPEPRIPAYAGIFFVAALTFTVLYFTAYYQSKQSQQKIWLPSELSLHNGTDENLPLLISITGLVFDVTKGASHYAKGMSYNQFCGRDATRAFATGTLAASDLTDNVANLTYDQLSALESWETFFKDKYVPVGKLVGRFFDSSGEPTKVLENLERRFARSRMELAKRGKDEEKFPSCSSRWAQETGGEVWCDSGFPRKVFRPGGAGAFKSRCACIQQNQLGLTESQEYPGCDPDAQRCVTSPPEKKST